MKIPLHVPFESKEEFKETCRKEKIPYFWDSEKKIWGVDSDLPLPICLRPYEKTPAKNRVHVVDCDYTYLPFAKEAGAKWDKKHRAVIFEGDRLPLPLSGFTPKPFSFPSRVEKKLNQEKPKILLPSRAIQLHPHQKIAQEKIVQGWLKKRPGFLLADETGLGKTISTWAAIQQIGEIEEKGLKILIVGPLNSLDTWRETIQWMGSSRPHDILLLNYEKLKNLFQEEEKKSKSLKGLAKFGDTESFDLLVFDESHYLKSPAAARTKLARKIEEAAKYTLWVSATAGQNPLELSYLSNLLAHKTGHRKTLVQKDFEVWCQSQGIGLQRGKFGKWVWENNTDDNQKLHQLLFGDRTLALRRRCQDIEGWPEIQRIPKSYEFTPPEQKLYETEWQEFLKALEEDQAARRAGQKDTAKGLERLLRLRQKASLLRVPHTCALAQELLENGYQVAISIEFLQTLDRIKETLEKEGIGCGEYSGRNTATREQERQNYQKGGKKVLIFSTETSISLHQENPQDSPRSQINHDLRWSGIEQEQIDGRSHRNGTHAPTYWCFAKNSVEEKVATILLAKLENMNTLRGDPPSFQALYKAIQPQ